MFETIKIMTSHCADCGVSLFFKSNTYPHPFKEGKHLCDHCNAKYHEYRRKKYFEALDKAMTNVINDMYKFTSDSSNDNY